MKMFWDRVQPWPGTSIFGDFAIFLAFFSPHRGHAYLDRIQMFPSSARLVIESVGILIESFQCMCRPQKGPGIEHFFGKNVDLLLKWRILHSKRVHESIEESLFETDYCY